MSDTQSRTRAKKAPSQLRQFSQDLQKAADLARHPVGRFMIQPIMRFYARKTLRSKTAQAPQSDANMQDYALEFQRMFPTKRLYRIVDVEDDVAYFDIQVECPLRASGDGQACHRMMQYDRSLAAGLGVNFEVLESQAITGAATCRVALRRK